MQYILQFYYFVTSHMLQNCFQRIDGRCHWFYLPPSRCRGLSVSQPHIFTADSKWHLNVGWMQTEVGHSFVQHGWWGNFKVLFIPPTVAMEELLGDVRLLCATAVSLCFLSIWSPKCSLSLSLSLHTDARIALLTKPSFLCSRQLFASQTDSTTAALSRLLGK